ncbi:FecCD family ABC transporter permease [Microbacterium sp.]|uniref:FecCD family ABC transporter permease n=1 Tax=Microbacterium sp. TaxID=51671 RepID=UPI0039E22CE4
MSAVDAAEGPAPIDFGGRVQVLRVGAWSTRLRVRALVVCACLLAALLAATVAALCLGDFVLTVPEVAQALVGAQSGMIETVVLEWRLPRVLAALLFGAALGVSGGIFQSLTRNPLASPDIIGMSEGAYVGAVLVIVVIGGGTVAIAAGSLAGGLLAAALCYLFAYRGGMQGFRLIIVGIAVSAMLGAVSTYLILRARLEVAMTAAVWGAGSLSRVGWAELVSAAVVIITALVALAALAPAQRQLELGDDAARAHGIRLEPARLGLVVAGVALTAAVTAYAGPIVFVALAAPQIARRLTRSPGIALVPAALVGALVMLTSDIIAQHLLPGSLPVGVVTIVIGGGYLVWLLISESRRRP